MKTKIEWCDYTINPVKGLCPVGCSYCYARRMYKRFKWNPEVRWEPEHLLDLNLMPNGSKVFIGSTIELFGGWVKEKWLQDFFYWWIPRYPQHTFIFLTKKPENLIKWSPFPDNCWVGVSATNQEQYVKAFWGLNSIEARVKFISFEPLLGEIKLTPMFAKRVYNWLIIGQQTPIKMSTMPKVGWVEDIVHAADKAKIPVFLKDNLISCVDQYPFAFSGKFPDIKLRQEFPKVE